MSYPVARETYVILEGETDIKLFRSLLDTSQCKIWWFHGGKSQLEHSLSEIVKHYPLVIGIRDADFLHLEGKKPETANLFLTDHHDKEMSMVHSDETFSKVANTYLGNEPTKYLLVRGRLLTGLKQLGYLRWLNEKHGWELIFEGLGLGEMYRHETISLDLDTYVGILIKRSPNAKMTDIEAIKAAIHHMEEIEHDLFQLCNGHDFMNFLTQYVRVAHKKMSVEQIDNAFRLAYHRSEFKKTQLYAAISQWCGDNGVNIHLS